MWDDQEPVFYEVTAPQRHSADTGDWQRSLLLFLGPTSTKPQAEILKLNNVNGCNDISFGDHSILEGDRIPPLKSHGQALEEELCFPGVLSDNRDAPANLLRHFYGCLMPCTCCLDGKRTEDVGVKTIIIIVML